MVFKKLLRFQIYFFCFDRQLGMVAAAAKEKTLS